MSDNLKKQKIWLVGAGLMAREYAKVLKAQGLDFLVIGRGEKSASEFGKQAGQPVITGGLTQFLNNAPAIADFAIVSVSVEQLAETTRQILNYGIKHVLVEKPAGLELNELAGLKSLAADKKAKVYVAYNRRFYAAVIKAKEIIEADGGVTSFNFEFTEWAHVIEKLDKDPSVMARLFLANSTHVADLAFYLGGKPKKINCLTAGKLSWHPSAAVFAGSGISEVGALFSYQANWQSAGRWGVEVLTNKHRLILRPLEKIAVQTRGSIDVVQLEIDDQLDRDFKPGLFRQVEAFLKKDKRSLCSIAEHYAKAKSYIRMANYQDHQ